MGAPLARYEPLLLESPLGQLEIMELHVDWWCWLLVDDCPAEGWASRGVKVVGVEW